MRAIATSTSRRVTERPSGQGACSRASGGSIFSPVARCQRLRENSPSAPAIGPVIAVVASCQGAAGEPSFLTRRSSPGACSHVSHRSSVMSMPPQKASASSTTTIFWWWQAPNGWCPSSAKWMRSSVKSRIQRPGRKRPGAASTAPFHFRMKISSASVRFTTALMNSPSTLGRPSGASPPSSLWPGSISISKSKSQPISSTWRSARSMASRRATK